MSALSDYLEGKIIDHIFRTASFTPPATLYFSLHTGATTDAGGGTEVSAGGYARIGVTANTSNFAAPISGDGHTENSGAITFGTPSANWGTVTHFAIWDAASAGNMLAHGALTASKTVNNGDPGPEFAAGTFDITFAMGSDYLDDKLANWLFCGQAFTKPTTLYFGLFTAAPTAAGGGTEVTGGSYARVGVTPLDANFAAPVTGDGHTENSGSIVFPAPTANWGSVLASAVYDASTAGNLLCFQTFTAKTVNNGDTAPRVLAGGFDYTIA